MEISIKKDLSGKHIAKPVGKIDTITSVEFGTTINDAIEDYDITNLILDFSEVVYISSMGLRMILELQKKMNGLGSMTLINANSSVMEVFKITGFDKILNIA